MKTATIVIESSKTEVEYIIRVNGKIIASKIRTLFTAQNYANAVLKALEVMGIEVVRQNEK